MDKNKYKELYIQESDELLLEMNKNLLILEKEHNNKDAINAIFRSAHTLKSMSASMGYQPIADLSHKMEDVLSKIRNNSISVSDSSINIIFQSFDILDRMVKQTQEDKSIAEDISGIINSLEQIISSNNNQPVQVNEEKLPDEITLNEFEKKTLARVKKDNFFCYKIKITLEKNCILKSVRAFMVFRNLHEIGEVIKSIPDSEKIEEEKFENTFECIFITKENKEIVEKKVVEILEIESAIVTDFIVDDSWLAAEQEKIENQSLAKGDKAVYSASDNSEQTRKLQTVRVGIERLDILMNLVEELEINKLRLIEVSSKIVNTDLKAVIEAISRITDDLQIEIMNARLIPVSQIFDRFPRFIRDISKSFNKNIKFEIIGSDVELDRSVLDDIGDPIIHLLRNAVDHGIESKEERILKNKNSEGTIKLIARRDKSYIFIEVADDGKGMDVEKIKKAAISRGVVSEEQIKNMTNDEILLITTYPGFSTKNEVTEISGRGVGLDVVRQKAESFGGIVFIESNINEGSKISMRLPLTTAVIKALLVKISNDVYAIPISSIVEIVKFNIKEIKTIEAKETILYRDKFLPIFRISKFFSDKYVDDNKKEVIELVVVESGSKQYGVIVDSLISQQEIVVKQLIKDLKKIKGFTGATILGNGKVALVIDIATLL